MASTDHNETLIARTLSNLAGAWREIAQSAARSVGRNGRAVAGSDPEALKAFMRECLEARGGEVSARMRAAELGEIYLELDAEGRRRFLEVLATEFGLDETALEAALDHDRPPGTPQGERAAGAGEVGRREGAALTLIRGSGTLEPTVGDIVREAGLSNQAFYKHFRSKHQLLVAVLDEGIRILAGYLAHRMQSAASPEAADCMRCAR